MTIDINSLVWRVVWLLGEGGIIWVLWWLLGKVNPPEPINKVLRCILLVAVALIVINFILTLMGHPLVHWR